MAEQEVGGIVSETFVMMWRLFIMAAVVIFAIIALGGVFSAKQDVRQAEAEIISGKIYSCISENGIVKPDNLQSCAGDYYVNMSIYSFDSDFRNEKISGNSIVGVNCGLLQKGVKMESYPSCTEKTYYALLDNSRKIEKGKLILTIGVEKYNENI